MRRDEELTVGRGMGWALGLRTFVTKGMELGGCPECRRLRAEKGVEKGVRCRRCNRRVVALWRARHGVVDDRVEMRGIRLRRKAEGLPVTGECCGCGGGGVMRVADYRDYMSVYFECRECRERRRGVKPRAKRESKKGGKTV